MEFTTAHYLAGAGFLLLVGACGAFIYAMRTMKGLREEVMGVMEFFGIEVASSAQDAIDEMKKIAK
jgi:hypothetical protein